MSKIRVARCQLFKKKNYMEKIQHLVNKARNIYYYKKYTFSVIS